MRNLLVCCGFIVAAFPIVSAQALDISVDSEEMINDSQVVKEEQLQNQLPQLFPSEQEHLQKKQARINEMIAENSVLRKALQDEASLYKYHWEREDQRRNERRLSGEDFKKRP
ncbi:hypothetical protein [Spartinivicinus poritis]|uniref:Uncharacterized protein n=1 Tax=Spartinivicinus poritis TaxID=2994640 RepID=A0ABT5U9Q5_9GAMM|nr:hypothetical protein [Spartinivicinus sp. A2-2]MDE1463089.1 hypothetical protein [Spartinivicinus sp. A2-2]